MSFGIRLHITGDYALFTRPEMKAERVSYDVITPSAARGVLEAIYWKPQIRWVIDRLHVLKPIRTTSIRRNEVASKIPLASARNALRTGSGNIGLHIEEDRQQRAALVLRDVAYVIEAHFEVLDARFDRSGPVQPNHDATGKHLDMFQRRARTGQCFQQPYFGTREFPVRFSLIEHGDALPQSELPAADQNRDLGYMLHDLDFDQDSKTKEVRSATPRFFRAQLVNGVITVPPFQTAVG